MTHALGQRTAPKGVKVFNPAFDVTPSQLVTAIVTEVGVARAPYRGALRRLVRRQEPERAQVRRSAAGSRRS